MHWRIIVKCIPLLHSVHPPCILSRLPPEGSASLCDTERTGRSALDATTSRVPLVFPLGG
jgi:hypothetical protein